MLKVRFPYRIRSDRDFTLDSADFLLDTDDAAQARRIVQNALYYALKVAADEEGVKVEPVT